jgi:intracellular multiplication protein IcmM
VSKDVWDLIKSSKRFNISVYRLLCTITLLSAAINVVLCILLSHIYYQRPEHVYYSTNGIVPPEMLHPLAGPNESSTPLLGSQPSAAEEKASVE